MTPLSPLAQGAAGLALAVSFALLGAGRTRSLVLLCAAQAALVALAAATQTCDACAAVALAEALLLVWTARSRAEWAETGPAAPPAPPLSPRRIATGGVLAVLATATPAGGIGLAIVLLGLLLVTERAPHRQALGIVALQNGLLLAGIARGLSGWHALPVAVPLLPAAACVGLWLPRRRSSPWRPARTSRLGRPDEASRLGRPDEASRLNLPDEANRPTPPDEASHLMPADEASRLIPGRVTVDSLVMAGAGRPPTDFGRLRAEDVSLRPVPATGRASIVPVPGMSLPDGTSHLSLPDEASDLTPPDSGSSPRLPGSGSRADRGRLAAGFGRVEAALCLLALPAAATLPWLTGHAAPFWSITARNAQIVLLVAALAAAAGWRDRHAARVPGARLAILAGIAFAVLAESALAGWLGMGVAALAAAAAALPRRPEAWKRLMLATTGLALALSGIVSLPARPSLAAAGLMLLGYGTLALLAPELAIAAASLALRLPGGLAGHYLPAGLSIPTLPAGRVGHPLPAGLAGHTLPGGLAVPTVPAGLTIPTLPDALPVHLLLAAGLAALLLAAAGLLPGNPRRAPLPLVDLAQAGVAVFAFGLGTPPAALAGLLQLTLLALTRCATRLARADGLDRTAALAGLAGVPPFGLFASLAMILAATAARAPWLLPPLAAGLGVVAWTLLRRLPAARHLGAAPAWLPLALALLCGLAMPGPLLAWFRLAAQ